MELFERPEDGSPFQTIELNPRDNKTGDIWHVFVRGLSAGALYLYRVEGQFRPALGHRFDARKYLFDPCAKAFTEGSIFKNVTREKVCPTDKMPKCVVIDDYYDWEDDRHPNIPLDQSFIYETHVKGFTASPSSGVSKPGTFSGLTEKIPYLQSLGITAIELLPVQEFDENENSNINPRTGERLKNFWGYSTIGFFAPKTSYSSDKSPGGAVKEFKDMIKAFHRAGIEVILDVVFNHTAEGNEHGLTFGFRGFDNSIYYHLVKEHKEYYINYSGCGNTVNCNHPVTQDFIIQCLRYWVVEMRVDGFRFDLAGVLNRDENSAVLKVPSLTKRIAEDPFLRGAKIIAEPWDCGGYFLGAFPGRWLEWNDKFRDIIRKFVRGDEYVSTEAATRLAGNSDLYSASGRNPLNSVNFISCHDGFTLNDLVCYNTKHNDENGENSRDGANNNFSGNNGFEGAALNPKIQSLRTRKIKNFFTILFVAQGVPMIVAGDEVLRTQRGNNNAYCQDNDISWFDWTLIEKNASMLEFVKRLVTLRMSHRVFRRNDFFTGRPSESGLGPCDVSWFGFDGIAPDWSKLNRFLAFRLGGGVGDNLHEEDNDFYIAINSDIHDRTVVLPPPSIGRKWFRVVDTSIDGEKSALDAGEEEALMSQNRYVIVSNSVIVLMSK